MIRIGGKKGENSCLPQTKQQTAFVLSNVKMKQVLYELFRNVFRKTFLLSKPFADKFFHFTQS